MLSLCRVKRKDLSYKPQIKKHADALEHINFIYIIMTSIPTYDFPSFSPILVVGFLGIAVSLYTLYTVNKAYYNSPFRGEA